MKLRRTESDDSYRDRWRSRATFWLVSAIGLGQVLGVFLCLLKFMKREQVKINVNAVALCACVSLSNADAS